MCEKVFSAVATTRRCSRATLESPSRMRNTAGSCQAATAARPLASSEKLRDRRKNAPSFCELQRDSIGADAAEKDRNEKKNWEKRTGDKLGLTLCLACESKFFGMFLFDIFTIMMFYQVLSRIIQFFLHYSIVHFIFYFIF